MVDSTSINSDSSAQTTRGADSGPDKVRSSWLSYPAFLLAAIGSSVGLGNIWKFPYELGLYGGTFLYVYIACVFLLGLPLMMAELMIGRAGKSNPVASIKAVAEEEGRGGTWQIIGWLGILTSFLIFSYYSVVASWILFYAMKSVSGAFQNVPAEIVQNSFGALLRNTNQQVIWHSVFVLLVVMVLSQGVRKGLERAVRLLMPLFIGLVIWLALFASQVGDFQRAYDFMFHFSWRDISLELVVSAMTQAFFSLSIGIGILIMYGSYLSQKRPIFTGAATIMVFDTAVALLMCFTIFSIVFAFGMQTDIGVGLIFETLPVAFAQMPVNGVLWSSAFFILLIFAALTSGFALFEPCVALLVESTKLNRRAAAWLIGVLAWLAGLISILSFNDWKFSFYYFGIERSNGFFDVFYILTTHVLLPLAALLIAVFAGWRIPSEQTREILAMRSKITYKLWQLCIRFVAPFIIALVLLLVLFFPA